MDFTQNDNGNPVRLATAIWPPGIKEATWARLEPILTVDQLRLFHLFGIPLVSPEADPTTGQHQIIVDEQLALFIRRAVDLVETSTGVTLMPSVVVERHPFDRPAFNAFGYMQLNRRPVWSVRQLTIQTADDQIIYTIPNQWLVQSALWRGRLNIVPLTLAFAGTTISPGPATGAAGAAFLNALDGMGLWSIPSYWGVEMAIGFPDGLLPVAINELVGVTAAMEILSMLGAAGSRVTSVSTGIDGLSQSVGLTGPNRYVQRLQDLQAKRDLLTNRVKSYFGLRFGLGVL